MHEPARLIAVAVLATLLTACGGNPKPESLPTPSPSSSPSPSKSMSPAPTLPEVAKQPTKAGAIAVARHYVALVNYAQSTGNVEALLAVEGNDCRSCKSGRKAISDVYSAGGTIDGGKLVVRSEEAFRNASQWLVTLGVEFEPELIDWPEPRADQRLKGGKLPMNLTMGMQDGQWKVLQWSRGA